jgi:hypothetical protein
LQPVDSRPAPAAVSGFLHPCLAADIADGCQGVCLPLSFGFPLAALFVGEGFSPDGFLLSEVLGVFPLLTAGSSKGLLLLQALDGFLRLEIHSLLL